MSGGGVSGMLVRSVLHSAVLAVLNLFGIWLGFIAFALAPGSNQLAIQLPIAFALSVAGFALWIRLLDARGPERLRVRWREGWWIFGLAPICAAAVFVPVHYVTQGYLTAFSNLLALWAFQIVTNIAAVGLGLTVFRKRA